LGVESFEMVISIYKNWPNDVCVGGFHSMNKDEYVDDLPSMEKFMKMKKNEMDKYEDVIVSLRLLDLEDDNNRLLVRFISCYLHLLLLLLLLFSILMFMFLKVDIFNLLFLVVIGLGVIWNNPCLRNWI
jgi:hypothetical protein